MAEAGTSLVTGAAGGIGRAVRAWLARSGHPLFLVVRDATGLHSLDD